MKKALLLVLDLDFSDNQQYYNSLFQMFVFSRIQLDWTQVDIVRQLTASLLCDIKIITYCVQKLGK